MLNISTDITTLDQEQRKALAAFILTFPRLADNATVRMPGAPISKETLQKWNDDESAPNPAEAFGPAEPTASAGPVLVADPNAPALDAFGLPWDERIHAGTKARTEQGQWRRKRGVTDELVAQVETELRQLSSRGENIPAQKAAPLIPTPPPATEPAPVVPPPPPLVAAEPAKDSRALFVELVNIASPAVAAKQMTSDELNAICMTHGVGSFGTLSSNETAIPKVKADVEALLLSR